MDELRRSFFAPGGGSGETGEFHEKLTARLSVSQRVNASGFWVFRRRYADCVGITCSKQTMHLRGASTARTSRENLRPELLPLSCTWAAQELARLCEKSGRWGPVPESLRGLTRKWGQSDLQARDPGLQWERNSRF